MDLLYKKLKLLGICVSDQVSTLVGTWKFVFIYTAVMSLWIILHLEGYLNIDPDFSKWSLFLSYFAGTQASIVLMSKTRQETKYRQEQRDAIKFDIKTLKIAKENNKKIHLLTEQLSMLEEVIEDFVGEEHENSKRS